MFNALNGLGGAGLHNAFASTVSNSAVYASFAIVGFFAGPIVNRLGIVHGFVCQLPDVSYELLLKLEGAGPVTLF